jgi:hypothetical protein
VDRDDAVCAATVFAKAAERHYMKAIKNDDPHAARQALVEQHLFDTVVGQLGGTSDLLAVAQRSLADLNRQAVAFVLLDPDE